MAVIDWIVVGIYILLIIGISYFIGKNQKNQDDYYLGGRKVPPWQVGSSMAANQVSAISLIGVPAFIAVKAGGGLKWLQYEMAVPLAMIFIIIFLVPLFRSTGGITIYQYLEVRFGTVTRSALSLIFVLSRSLATGVALLATAYVTSVCVELPLYFTIVIIGVISLVYTAMGGIMADIYSDLIQLVILWISSVVVLVILYNLLDGNISFPTGSADRLLVFDMKSTGLGDGSTFSFWPMLFGGLFLYISYYGCDQSQAQRLLATQDNKDAQKSLMINSLIRFPVVITYSLVGILLIIFLNQDVNFAQKVSADAANYIMPNFFKDYLPMGFLGLTVAGIFAASMSSLDSAINSLSAATWEDFLIKVFPKLDDIEDNQKIIFSRVITVFWGFFCTVCAIFMSRSSETVVELVNKIGSAFYGPIAGVFFLGFLYKKAGQKSAIIGLLLGVATNIVLWINFSKTISWLWWNIIGFSITVLSGFIMGYFLKEKLEDKPAKFEFSMGSLVKKIPKKYVIALVMWFLVIILLCYLGHIFFS